MCKCSVFEWCVSQFECVLIMPVRDCMCAWVGYEGSGMGGAFECILILYVRVWIY